MYGIITLDFNIGPNRTVFTRKEKTHLSTCKNSFFVVSYLLVTKHNEITTHVVHYMLLRLFRKLGFTLRVSSLRGNATRFIGWPRGCIAGLTALN